MLQPLISILTPFKNSELFLEDCLNSIIDQTYTNWELLIVDDHSTDESYNLVISFAHKDARIKVSKNSGNGIIDALNLGFENSSGDFITRMDSDDVMAPNKLQLMGHDLITHGKGHVALGLVNYFCEGELGEGYQNYEKWLNALTRSGTNYTDLYKECVIPSPCWMVHRDDLMACGSFESTIYPEDYDLAFRFYKQGLKCIPSHAVLHHWRDYSTRTSRTHENYAANHFLKLKLDYFLKLDRNPDQPLVLWGAGFKGKLCAKLLQKHHVPFIWICNNPKKIGQQIYKMELQPVSSLSELNQPQVIVTVANKTSQKRITSVLENQALVKAKDYFFFC
ncbi:glycosyltransferase involved in cell wall biosynthesis [Gelidibacter algens]|uniref:Glycosyltransferase involved in cell wall biosynthesis n=1 Tax=Gelidibacter algens TaxID=49280 RepID=A0A1A7QP44_9FLAO|nr:glycosyltransferase family 2 protein [Gelidibacter algens]OBX21835.1 glycosyl transferase family 2 [Gelidibacter algens]RAJ27486.1 glycosyltransferase involved in cell wall biosynthesis [Gelidibacter algens]